MNPISYKGYTIEVLDTHSDFRYIIKKDKKVILESAIGWIYPNDAEIQAKLYVNRLESRSKENKSGWTIS
jgi:hypothetical protein